MEKLAKYNRTQVLDLLSERLAFEKASVPLYDRVIAKSKQHVDLVGLRTLELFEEHRQQEKDHAAWLEEQIRALGGDVSASTDLAKLVLRESAGIEDIAEHDDDIQHLLHALLAAELVDNAGWDMLVALAAEAPDEIAVHEFQVRRSEELDHLALAREALLRLTMKKVLPPDLVKVAEPPA